MTTQPTPQATAPSAEPVAWIHDLSDPQPRCVTALKYRSWADAELGKEYVPVYLHPSTDLRAELSAMTAERDTLDEDVTRLTNLWDNWKNAYEILLADLCKNREREKTAHADTLAELRKVAEELGALKVESAEMEKDAVLFHQMQTQDFTDVYSEYTSDRLNQRLHQSLADQINAAITAQGEKQ